MAVIFFVVGACLGSFYLVVGKRLPKNENITFDRSHCDHCDHVLSWYELIPIFSYLFLLGRCRKCKGKISPLNIIMEIVTGSLFTFGFLYYGLNYDLVVFLIIVCIMLIIFISDFLYYIILDSPLVIGSLIYIIMSFFVKGSSFTLTHIVSGIGLFAAMYLMKIFGDVVFKRESLGGGDIKLAFVMGLILGFRLGLVSLILSAFLALPYSYAFLMLKKNNEVPYGPFLAASLFILFVFAEKFNVLLEVIFRSL